MTKKTTLTLALFFGACAAGMLHAQNGPSAPPSSAPGPMFPGGGPGMGGPPGHSQGGHHMPEGPGGPMMLPPGTWWRNQEIVSAVGLSADQQKRIDQIFLDARVQLIHMHASLEEEQLKLDSALQMTPLNQSEAASEIDKIADTRANLEKTNAKMLLTIRGVLSADQWTKLQAAGPRPGPPIDRDGKRGDRGDHRGSGHAGRPGGDTPPAGL